MTEEKADQIIRCVKECWWRVGVLLALILGFAVFVMGGWPEMSQTTAAWVQALGSIGAILVAVYILYRQQQHYWDTEEHKTLKTESRLLLSLQTEIEVRWEQYMDRLGEKIESGEIKTMGPIEWRTPENPFPVFASACSELGVIRDRSLLALVIRTFAELESLLITSHLLIDFINQSHENYSNDPSDENLNVQRAHLLELHEQIKEEHNKGVRLVQEFLLAVRI